MKTWLSVSLGLLAMALGAVFTFQGLGLLGGSSMTGDPTWAVIGPILVLVGLALAVWGRRRRRTD